MGDKKLDGMVALVTGAARGMGKATALRLAGDGARVVIGDIAEEALLATRDEIIAAKGEALAIVYDAADHASSAALVSGAVEWFGQLDAVANIAAISAFYRLDELNIDVWRRFFAINTESLMVICREAMPHLIRSKGCIVNFASVNAKQGVAYQSAYAASKAAVLALTQCLAQEFMADGVRVNAVCPGPFDTPMNHDFRFPEGIDGSLLQRVMLPGRRMLRAENAASLVAYLVSAEAEGISGAEMVIDGGLLSLI